MEILRVRDGRTRVFGASRKRFRLTKWHALSVGLLVVVIVQAVFVGFLSENPQSNSASSSAYDSLNKDYLALQANYDSLQKQYETLNMEYLSLQNSSSSSDSRYLALQARYDQLNSEYLLLLDNYNSLNSSYNSLNAQYVPLQSNYNQLTVQYNTLNSQYQLLVSSYNALNSSYNQLNSRYRALEDSFNLATSWYNQMQYLINQRSQHYGVTDFVTANDPSVRQMTFQITGGWTNTSDWNEYWTDVKAMYDWVVANVEYRSDGLFPVLPPSLSGNVSYSTEMWQYPNETLSLRKGDCEDMAVLLCSMIRYYSNEAYLAEVVLIKSSSSGHSAVQLPVSGGNLAILDPAGQYYTHDGLGNITSKDISAEVDSWLSYWKSQGIGNDVYINRVFSSYLDNTFATTGDYTSWMYTR